ncbi:hypothetical protein, partial [Klebsiella variicola]|uniref:hypothetical protein n=1 Tax=Klebsiella variicola TaxID=244366 RepID=UPI002731BBDC
RFEPGDLAAGFSDGLHTLSGAGGGSFLDLKSVRRDRAEPWLKTQYKLRRALGLNGSRRTGVDVYPALFSPPSASQS